MVKSVHDHEGKMLLGRPDLHKFLVAYHSAQVWLHHRHWKKKEKNPGRPLGRKNITIWDILCDREWSKCRIVCANFKSPKNTKVGIKLQMSLMPTKGEIM